MRQVTLDSEGVLLGPDPPGDLLECTLGLPCDVDVAGYGLADTNRIVALSEKTAWVHVLWQVSHQMLLKTQ